MTADVAVASTAADVVPREMLADEGITMNNIIPVYLGGQDKIINALLNNEITAAGIKESLFEKIKGAHLKVLKTSAPLPNFVFCSRPAMPAKIEKEFVNALLTLKPASHPGDAKAVSDWDDEIKHGFVLPVNDYIQNSLELLMLFKKFTE